MGKVRGCWGQSTPVAITDLFPSFLIDSQILLLSDGSAKWSASLGLSVDLSAIGFGVRTGRYALILDDLVVKYVEVYIQISLIFHR